MPNFGLLYNTPTILSSNVVTAPITLAVIDMDLHNILVHCASIYSLPVRQTIAVPTTTVLRQGNQQKGHLLPMTPVTYIHSQISNMSAGLSTLMGSSHASFTTLHAPSAADTHTPVTCADTHAPLGGAAYGSVGWATFAGAPHRSGWRRLARTSRFWEQNAPLTRSGTQ